ncbi:MAG: hypothetical protein ABI579_04240 [Candidatus Sumerlaeota bacterium]
MTIIIDSYDMDIAKTLGYVDGYLFMLAFVGAAYLHFAFATHSHLTTENKVELSYGPLGIPMTMLQVGLILVAVGMLVSYAKGARR